MAKEGIVSCGSECSGKNCPLYDTCTQSKKKK